jgi:type I restriction enzyme S subunit
MQQLFPAEGEPLPKLRFPEFRGKGEWDIKPLGAVGDNLDSRRVPITEADRVKGAVPYYGASGIIDYVEGYIFDEDILCISEDGANLVARTYPIAFSVSGKSWVNNHAHVLKLEHPYTQVIVENYLNAINLEDFLTGMAQPKLNRAKLDIIPIPLPDKDEQQKIADCLTSIDELITAQSQKIDALKAHKKGLMQQLFPTMDEVSA